MKNEFNDIYEMLYAEYIYENEFRRRRPFPDDEYYIVRTIRKYIDTVDKGNTLRSDAKYFLLVNFHHLIVRPLFEQKIYRDYRTDKEFIDLENNIQADITTIISDTTPSIGEEKISGHQIMGTIDRVWKNLKTTKLEIWG